MPLEWVGMKGIDLPVVVEEADYRREHHARVDAEVNLPRPDIRGIHMSRLEDAARRIREALGEDYAIIDVTVTHMESLHPHDAVASAGF